ncbi:MAG: nucleoside recognition domain-containing protein [Bacillota bacterium]
MELIILIYDTIISTLISIGRLALILIPILILIEIARYYQVIEKFTFRVKALMQFLTLPQEAAFPLLGGLIFGIVLGSALIIDSVREGYLEKRDLLLIGIFLSISHSIIEDTFIFAAFGANPVIMIGMRAILAILITRIAAYSLDRLNMNNI